MTVYDGRSDIEALGPPPLWICALPGLVMIAAGVIRCMLSFAHWRQNGWMMLVSGVLGLLAGVLILFGFPTISLWALGFLLGVDLISHGPAWLLYALQSVWRTA